MANRILVIFLSTLAVFIAVIALLFVLLILDVISRNGFEEAFDKIWKVALIGFVASSLISLIGWLRGK